MDLLLPFLRLFNPRKLKGVRVLRGKGQAMRLYQLLRGGQVRTDEEARRALFDDNPHGGVYLSGLKRELRERMVNTYLCLPADGSESVSFQAYQTCTKELAVVQHLLARGARPVAARLAHRAVRQALKFQFAEQVVALSRLLYTHYSSIEPNRQQKEHWRETAEYYNRVNQAEWRLETSYNEITYLRTVSKSMEPYPGAAGVIDEVVALMQAFPEAYRVHLLGFNILIYLYILENNHARIIDTCRQAIAFFRALNYPTGVNTIFSFAYKMIPSFIQLEEYAAAKAAIADALDLAKPATFNWFAIQYYQVVLGFYSGDLPLAHQAITAIKAHRIPFATLREQLLIAEAYGAFFNKAGYIDAPLPSFRLGRFLNEVPTYSRDKRGMNINILILQTLFLLLDGAYDRIIDRTEALAMYTHRYLRHDEHFRSNCFIKMLLLLPRHAFRAEPVERQARPLLEKLRAAPVQADYDVEIVPYTTLWKVVSDLLKR